MTQAPIPIAFEEKPEEDVRRQNADNRYPILDPGRCMANELLFPGDDPSDWICDCVPGFVYHLPSDKCHQLYLRGPCNTGEYLVLQRGKVTPECEQNPCPVDGQVPIKGTCYELGKSNPCPQPELSYVLGVNTTTLEITCLQFTMTLPNRFDEGDTKEDPRASLDFKNLPLCAPGSKRSIYMQCPRTVFS